MSLSTKAMKVALKISSWSPFKLDKSATTTVHASYQTHKDAGNFNKRLIARKGIAKIQALISVIRIYHYKNTLPWEDNGYRLLPSKNYMDYTHKMRQFSRDFDIAVAEFLHGYPNLILDAQSRLGQLYDASEYPLSTDLRYRFDIKVDIVPVETAGDFRVKLSDDEVAKIKADIEVKSKKRETKAMEDLWTRLYGVIKKMADRLEDEDAVFRNSLVKNVEDLIDLLPKMNIADDQDLETLATEIKDKLLTASPNELRTSKETRKDVVDSAKNLLGTIETMSGFMGSQAVQ